MKQLVTHRLKFLACIVALVLSGIMLNFTTVSAQDYLQKVPFPGGVVPDHMKTMVIGTRFVRTSEESISPRLQFEKSRIPLSEFNRTDHCVDKESIKVAEEYFRTLGKILEQTGYFYELPENKTAELIAMCERKLRLNAKEIRISGTRIIAFGRVVPTQNAPDLERTLR